MNDVCDYLSKAFKGSNAPYINDICRISRNPIVKKIPWWIQGIFEILEELINDGYMPTDNYKADCLFQAISLLELMEVQDESE